MTKPPRPAPARAADPVPKENTELQGENMGAPQDSELQELASGEEFTSDVTGPTVATGPDLSPAGLAPAEPLSASETPAEGVVPVPVSAPLVEFVILNGPISYGPVKINGQLVRCRRDVLYQVPDVEERVVILGTGRFRLATKADQVRAGQPSSGPSGAVTRALLPPGALKGGLNQ